MEIISDTTERIRLIQFDGSREERLEVTATMEADGWQVTRSRLNDVGICVEYRKQVDGS
ncbi:hypothetical protein MHI37_18375 [Paenibacillus sp. FSL H8-0548]|uniref:hypothetical protein n=1 Tax=Paenibacillus sp. FSL H8-0548 TaxID=1920422 RepID=UPI0015C316A5|nr:hypothetical protein [Paenibacillus sp. FSL H8-0548]